MFNSATEQMTFSQVHTTTDYFMFKAIAGNRNVNSLHLSRLRESMQKNYLFTIILVNQDYEIIDGHHRFEIIKELGLPMNYIVIKNYGLNEVHILNSNLKKWCSEDYMEGYCNLGMPDYITYKNFKNKYGVGHHECMALLGGINSRPGIDAIKNFHNGLFKVKNLQDAERKVDLIFSLKAFYKGYKRTLFIWAMLKLMTNENFEFVEFVSKLKLQPLALTDCKDVDQYIAQIEEIYNYKRRDKMNLRF
jgi:hypothetical protein